MNANSNQLEAIDLSKCLLLRDIDLSNNQLKALDLSKNPDIYGLYVDDNQLEALDLRNLLKLENIALTGNKLTSLEMLPSDRLNSYSDIFFNDDPKYGEPPLAQEYSINVDIDAKKPDELQFDVDPIVWTRQPPKQ